MREIDPSLYPVRVQRLRDEDGGGWLAEVPDLPGCLSDGETAAAAIDNAQGAIVSWIDAATELGRPVPAPSSEEASYSGQFRLRLAKSLHRRLAERAAVEGVSLNTLTTMILAEALGQREHAAGR